MFSFIALFLHGEGSSRYAKLNWSLGATHKKYILPLNIALIVVVVVTLLELQNQKFGSTKIQMFSSPAQTLPVQIDFCFWITDLSQYLNIIF